VVDDADDRLPRLPGLPLGRHHGERHDLDRGRELLRLGVGAAAGGLAAFKTNQPIGANTARILVGLAVPAASAATIPANTEMFAFNLVISNTKTTGTGSCAGCTTAACLVFQNLKIAIGTSNAAPISTGNTAGSNFATWQGTAASCAAVPTRNSTWSGVKSLYR
jgi:hypothetical protein